MNSAAGLPEPVRKLELLIKLIADKQFIIIFFTFFFLAPRLQPFLMAPRTEHRPWYTGLNGCVPLPPRELRPQCKPPASNNLTPGPASVLLPIAQLVRQFLSQLWQNFRQESCICLKVHSHSGSSVKADHSGGTPNSSRV